MYDVGQKLVEFVIHKLGAKGAATFSVMIDDCHDEVLSIFFEQLAAYKMGIDNYVNFRLKELSYYINWYFNTNNYEELYICSTYIKSTLKAFKLLSLYLENKDKQKDIIKTIQCVFDGYINVEQLLKGYNVYYDNSKRNLRQIKHI